MSFDRLIAKIIETQNPSVVGLDPKLDYIPSHITQACIAQYGETLEAAAQAFLEYNKGIIDAICDIVPAIKPQAAYYEALGWQGMKTLAETVAYAKSKGMYVIMDGKRNDIGSTMEMYASAHLGETTIEGKTHEAFGADALTVNGYLGSDGILPALKVCKEREKGIFVLVKTSNPSSGELQDRLLDTQKAVYAQMGAMCEEWGTDSVGTYGYSAVGAVVGATYPQQLTQCRQEMPHTFFLVPGYGAQGGTAQDIAGAFDRNGWGAIVNSSRAILTAWKKKNLPGEQYAQGAREAALEMKEDIGKIVSITQK